QCPPPLPCPLFPFPLPGPGLGEGLPVFGSAPTTTVTEVPSFTFEPPVGSMPSTIPSFFGLETVCSTTFTNRWTAPSADRATSREDPTTSGIVTVGATPLLTK